LYGGDDSDQLDGGGGVDQLFGEDGGDVLNGGIGNDKLDGGTGADTMDGGEGNDTYTVDDVNDVVSETISGIPGGKDVVKSSAATFTLGANIETLNLTGSGNINGIGNDEDNAIAGNSGHNLIQGGGGIDKISAGGGNDTVEGGSGNDAIKGQGGNDTLYGDDGNDQITGGDGTDEMWGGVGNDKFIFGSAAEAGNGVSRDVIMDFESVDVVNLRAIDAIDGGSDNAFTFIATGAFTAAGQLRYYDDGSGNTIIEGNTDGNAATAEFQIELRGYTGGLVLNDLIL
jgi:Ca2+-binding RTX toxin-like protein